MLQRTLGLFGNIYLAFFQALDEVFRRQVHQFDRICAVENRIRHGFANAHMRDLRDNIVQALDMLDVDRGINVNPIVKQLLHVEIALGMAAARRVGVGQFVHQNDLRSANENGIKVHLVERLTLILYAATRNRLEPIEQRFCLLPSMGFNHARDDVIAVLDPCARG